MRAWLVGLLLLGAGCESGNIDYYYVCATPLGLHQGRFTGYIEALETHTLLVDSYGRTYVIEGRCSALVLDGYELDRYQEFWGQIEASWGRYRGVGGAWW